jgi:hypothetical protein
MAAGPPPGNRHWRAGRHTPRLLHERGRAGTTVENQMHQPAAAAGQQLSGNPLMGPGQITPVTGRYHQRTGSARTWLG